jgi:hypothetical protein
MGRGLITEYDVDRGVGGQTLNLLPFNRYVSGIRGFEQQYAVFHGDNSPGDAVTVLQKEFIGDGFSWP